MADTNKLPTKIRELITTAETVFGQRVEQVTAPGGRSRDSLRVHFKASTVIATRRKSAGRGAHEVMVLEAIGPDCAAVPALLGQSGDWHFQQDAGQIRLSRAIQDQSPDAQLLLARKAIAGIFDLQQAANSAGLVAKVPRLGEAKPWIQSVIDAPAALAANFGLTPPLLDQSALMVALDPPERCFVKWDCRAGNAALDEIGHLRWFDFEYAGQRHGAEDFAWLIGDEVWPVSAEAMIAAIADIGKTYGKADETYLDYLALYTCFHIVQRLTLIRSEVLRRGWLGITRILGKDDVGATPVLAKRLCERGAALANRHPLAAPLGPFFADVGAVFDAALLPAPSAADAT